MTCNSVKKYRLRANEIIVILQFTEQRIVSEVPIKVRAEALGGAAAGPLGGRPRLALGRGASKSSGELSRSTCSLASPPLLISVVNRD